MNKSALMIVDIQVSLFSDIHYNVYKADELLENIRTLVQRAHESNTQVIYIQHTNHDQMAEGSPGWEIHPSLKPVSGDLIIQKFTPDSFSNTPLRAELEARDIKRLVICGLQTEYCIDTTCRRAFSLGYETILVKDGHSTFDVKPLSAAQIIEHHHRIMADWFASLVLTQDVTF